MKKTVLHVNGGMGKNLMATAMAKAVKTAQPDREIIVVTAWPQIWLNNEYIWRVYKQGNTPYFFEDHVKDQDSKILLSDPYTHEAFIQNKRSCADVWCEQSGVPYNGEMPNLYLTAAEKEIFARRFSSQDPIFVIQSNGGMPSGQKYATSWQRDLPLKVAQQLVNWANNNGYKVIHVRLQNQPELMNTQPFWTDNIREVFGLLMHSTARVLIDSFAQHACMALGLKSVVCWPVDNVTSLGYAFHDNVVSKAKTKASCLIDSYLRDYNITGELHECPFADDEIFMAGDIVSRIVDARPKMPCLVAAPEGQV